MIKGYDDYHERLQRGLSAYTQEGLINKINEMQESYEAATSETALYRDGLTELLKMEWVGNVCPDDVKIIATVKARIEELEAALLAKQILLMPSAPSCYADARKQAAIEQLQSEGLI